MNRGQRLLAKFDGLKFRQEYLCLAKEALSDPFSVYLVSGGRIVRNISSEHLFIGYSPLIIGLPSAEPASWLATELIGIAFTTRELQQNEILRQKDAIAEVSLKKIRVQGIGGNELIYFEGLNGKHRFLAAFYQSVARLSNRLYNQKAGNVFLKNNLLEQVQIAYSLPRKISLITVSDQAQFNLFPTDLHGPVLDSHYVISLRHGGKACEQVEQAGQLAISEVDYREYQRVYSLGKNHMQPLKPENAFEFSGAFSKLYRLPLPRGLLGYLELKIEDSFQYGIHKLLLFKVVFREEKLSEPLTLAHIHRAYATWRYNKGLSGNYLLR